MSREERPGEIYLEFRPIGQQVKVTAIRKLRRRLEQEGLAAQNRPDPTLY